MFSVVITTFNDAEFLPRAIESAVKYSDDVIVVDDHSDIDPEAIVAGYPVRYIRHERNKRLSWARNTGIREAKYDRYITLDADDYLLPGVMELEKHDADIVYGNLVYAEDTSMVPNKNIELDHFKVNNQLYPTSLVKKSVWQNVKFIPFDYSYPEDWLFWARCMKAGYKFEYVPVDVYYHTFRSGSEWERMKHKDWKPLINSYL